MQKATKGAWCLVWVLTKSRHLHRKPDDLKMWAVDHLKYLYFIPWFPYRETSDERQMILDRVRSRHGEEYFIVPWYRRYTSGVLITALKKGIARTEEKIAREQWIKQLEEELGTDQARSDNL